MPSDIIKRFSRIPPPLRLPIIGNIALFIPNFLWAFSQMGTKIDPGLATLLGATFGLGIVGWQANRGFKNLIRSQANQAELDRDARLHKSELENKAKQLEVGRETTLLLAGIRAEIAAIHSIVYQQRTITHQYYLMSRAFAEHKVASTTKTYTTVGINAPVFQANISKIGLLGTDLGADVIKALSKADGKTNTMTLETAIPQEVLAILSAARYSFLQQWASDLYHVAVRIRSVEDNTPDPGSLASTETARYAGLKDLDK